MLPGIRYRAERLARRSGWPARLAPRRGSR